MSEITTSNLPPLKASEVRHPFGLPLGSVRGLMSILICAFFWILLLLPGESTAQAVLAHFFLLGLVFMAFASSPSIADKDVSPFLPWLLRLIFVGGSIAVIAYVLITKDIGVVQKRLTPDVTEFQKWWMPFLGTMSCGFAFGIFIRFVLGRDNHIFQSIRAWLSVMGLIMLGLEIAIFFVLASGAGKMDEVIHIWQSIELAVVAAYFGTRA